MLNSVYLYHLKVRFKLPQTLGALPGATYITSSTPHASPYFYKVEVTFSSTECSIALPTKPDLLPVTLSSGPHIVKTVIELNLR